MMGIIRQKGSEVPPESEAAANGRQNRDLAILGQLRIQQFFAAYVFVVEKDIDMPADLAAFGQYTIAHAGIHLPQLRQRLTNSCGRSLERDDTPPGSEIS